MDLAYLNQKSTQFKKKEDYKDRVFDAIEKKF